MSAVLERVDEAERRVSRWRRRTVGAGVLILAVGIGALWALTRGPASGLAGDPIEHGGLTGEPVCSPEVPRLEVDDTFGGGGTILRYRESAECRFMFSIINTTAAPVTIVAIEQTPKDFISALRLNGASRSRGDISDTRCHGCWEQHVSFEPFEMRAGEEFEIGVYGVMNGCRPPRGGFDVGGRQVYEHVDVTVRTLGVERVVPIELYHPVAIAVHDCPG